MCVSLATTTVASINVAFYTTRRRRRRKSWLLLLLFFYDSLCSARCIYADVDGYTVQIDKLKKRWEDCPARYARNEAKKRSRRRRRKKNNNRQQPTNKQFQVKSWSEEWKGVCARHDKLVISCLGNRGRRRRRKFFFSFFLSLPLAAGENRSPSVCTQGGGQLSSATEEERKGKKGQHRGHSQF